MENTINKLMSEKNVDIADGLLEFMKNYEERFTFDELNDNDLRKQVWQTIFKLLNQAKYFTIHRQCLQVLRILSRDKTNLNDMITQENLCSIVKKAGPSNAKILKPGLDPDYDVVIEALKLLCNLLYNSTSVQKMIGLTSCLKCVVERISLYDDRVPDQIKLFDTRVLFLATALNPELRNVVAHKLKGIGHVARALHDVSTKFKSSERAATDEDVVLACEILKLMFNLYMKTDEGSDYCSVDDGYVASVLWTLLVQGRYDNVTKLEELESNIINLLTVLPDGCCAAMTRPVESSIVDATIYKNTDMTAVDKIIKFLDKRLDTGCFTVENLSPVVTALIRLVKSERLIRKYTRLQVLPPLKDVMKRPEEGNSLRAKLCKLLTSPIPELSDLIAEFIFILCKENVNRMVKYTGYGNAAGMFANKGLLGKSQTSNCGDYSSESEDSDTEEYVRHKENINPVTGCYEHPKENPLEGMTDEQKEYEAMKLVSLVDKLTRQGVVQPCRIGQDGKPKPIEHILELQDQLPKLTVNTEKTD